MAAGVLAAGALQKNRYSKIGAGALKPGKSSRHNSGQCALKIKGILQIAASARSNRAAGAFKIAGRSFQHSSQAFLK